MLITKKAGSNLTQSWGELLTLQKIDSRVRKILTDLSMGPYPTRCSSVAKKRKVLRLDRKSQVDKYRIGSTVVPMRAFKVS